MTGLIGSGLLGSALAERFLAAGGEVLGFDVDPARRAALAALGGRAIDSAAAVAESCDRIVLSLPNSDVVEAVLREIGPTLRAGQTIVDTTTGGPDQTEAIGRRLAEAGVEYLDATVSGSSADVRQGAAVVMVGGERPAFDACTDLFRAFAKSWHYLGSWGSGSKMKLVTNLILGLNRAALAEGLSLAGAMGIDLASALDVLKQGAAYSRAMDTKGEKMVRGDFQPQARLSQHLKDVRLILSAAERAGSPTPLSALHRQLLESLEQAGCGDLDNSAIIKAFTR
jgi:3-hydroxyisobutyrate dehydrogenase-like beta-hydroxyacid dehydrogenase